MINNVHIRCIVYMYTCMILIFLSLFQEYERANRHQKTHSVVVPDTYSVPRDLVRGLFMPNRIFYPVFFHNLVSISIIFHRNFPYLIISFINISGCEYP